MPDPASTSSGPMGPVQASLFRCGLIYFALYALPFPLPQLSLLLNQGFGLLSPDAPLPGLLKEIGRWAPDVHGFWRGAVEQLASWEHWPFQVMPAQPTGSGDTAFAFSRVSLILIFAVLLGLLWSMLDRSPRGYRGLKRWTHLAIRWYTGAAILGYGLAKVYATQMGDVSLTTLMRPFGDKSPMGLVWAFLGHSEPYEFFSGLMETVGALLLFWRGTSLLGCVVLIPTMLNVVLLNWMYDVPVKLYSTHLLVFCSALLLPELKRLWLFFVRNHPAPTADHQLVDSKPLRVCLIVIGSLIGGAYLLSRHDAYSQRRNAMLERRAQLPAEYGVYRVETMKVDGNTVAPGAPTRWRWFALDAGKQAWAQQPGGRRLRFYCARSETGDSLLVGKYMGRDKQRRIIVPKHRATWSMEVGSRDIAVQMRAPRQRSDYGKTEPVAHRTIRLRGRYDGRDYELQLVERRFNLLRGFHLIQELPYHR